METTIARYSVDLHMHSTFSDGELTPEQLVTRAHQRGIHILALSDHDTIAGIPSFLSAVEKRNQMVPEAVPMVGIPAVEVDVNRLHILAYGACPDHPLLAQLFAHSDQARCQRAQKIMKLLDAQGVHLDEKVQRDICQKSHPSRYHIAKALVEMGAVADVSEAFDRYLKEGRPSFVSMNAMSTEAGVPVKSAVEAVRILKKCGAVVVLAHPMRITHLRKHMRDALIEELCKAGLDGMEVFHPSACNGDVKQLLSLAKRKGLLVTGGSDFHNDQDPRKNIGQMPEGWNNAVNDAKALLAAMAQCKVSKAHEGE